MLRKSVIFGVVLLLVVTLYLNEVSLVGASSDKPIADQIYEVCVGKFDNGYVTYDNSKCVDRRGKPLNQVLEELVKSKCGEDKVIFFPTTEESFGDYISTAFEISDVYDPNGVSVGTVKFGLKYSHGDTTWGSFGVKCPDRSRPGYWTIVFEDGSKVTFYVSEKTRGFSVQAICGPASIAGLALLPLLGFGIRRKLKG
ncbi:hypothetical protein [Thermococcus sp.]